MVPYISAPWRLPSLLEVHMKPLLLQLHFWEGGNEKRRCLNWPGQGPASTAPALKVSSHLGGASEGNSAQAGHRMPTALWARESDFQEPKASSAVCPAVHVSWSAPQMSPSHSQGTDGYQPEADHPPVPISTLEAPGEHLQFLSQHRARGKSQRGCSKGRQREEGFLFLSTPGMML